MEPVQVWYVAMKTIKIIYLVNELLPFGGGEIFIRELIKHTPKNKVLFEGITSPNIHDSTLDYPVKLYPVAESVGLDADMLLFSGRLEPDILEKFNHIPIRILFAQSDFNVNWYFQPCASFATHILAVSQGVKKALETTNPCHVILPGIDFDTYTSNITDTRSLLGFKQSDYVVGYFGRMNKLKNVDRIIEAIASINEVKLLLIGNGQETNALLRQAADIIPHRYVYISYVNPDRIGPFYEAIDVFCLVSEGEGCPRVLWESLYHGKPFIGTPVGSIPEVIENGVNGFVIDGMEGIAQAITASRELRGSPLIRRTALEFGSIHTTVTQFVEYLENLQRSALLL